MRRTIPSVILVTLTVVIFAGDAVAMYHPGQGCFMQRDPWKAKPAIHTAGDGYQDGMNLYTYVGSNPINYVDPTGEKQGPSNPRARCKQCNGTWTRKPSAPNPPLTNGCSSPFGDAPSGCSFLSSCNTHDRCYADCNSTKGKCDQKFYQDMIAACVNCCQHLSPSKTRGLPPRQRCLSACSNWADRYFRAVKLFGLGPYNNAQKDNCYCKK